MITLLKRSIYNKLFRSVFQLAKKKFQLLSTAANCLMRHENIIGIKSLWERYTEHCISEWLVHLNKGGIVIQTTIARLNQAQIDMLSTKPIWELDTESIKSWNFKHNLNANILVMARELDINITKNPEVLQEKLISITRSLRDILGKELDKKMIQGLQNLDILYLEQLLNSKGTTMITWYQLKKIKRLSTKRRKTF